MGMMIFRVIGCEIKRAAEMLPIHESCLIAHWLNKLKNAVRLMNFTPQRAAVHTNTGTMNQVYWLRLNK